MKIEVLNFTNEALEDCNNSKPLDDQRYKAVDNQHFH